MAVIYKSFKKQYINLKITLFKTETMIWRSKMTRIQQRFSRNLKRQYVSHAKFCDRLIPSSERRWGNVQHAFLILPFSIQAAPLNKTKYKSKWPFFVDIVSFISAGIPRRHITQHYFYDSSYVSFLNNTQKVY